MGSGKLRKILVAILANGGYNSVSGTRSRETAGRRRPMAGRELGAQQRDGITICILFFFACSVLGWCWEVALCLASEGEFVNRGILFGPWLPIYGFGGLMILLLLSSFREKPLQIFWGAAALCGVLEYATAWFLESFLHTRWWDYRDCFLNLQGRVCLEGLLAFGVAGVGCTYWFAPLFGDLCQRLTARARRRLCIVLLALFVLDAMYSMGHPNVGDGIAQECRAAVNRQTVRIGSEHKRLQIDSCEKGRKHDRKEYVESADCG